jgi:hypothetical protein
MLGRSLLGAGVPRRAARFVTATLAVAGFGAVGGCLTRPLAPIEPLTTSVVVEKLPSGAVDKIDLLLVIDNSSSMADKQQILSAAIPDLLTGLLNPNCVDGSGTVVVRPTGPLDACPSGSTREFPPVLDVHVGVITSSLGSLGTNGCPTLPSTDFPGGNPTMDDQGHLISRSDATNPTTSPVDTYQGLGYLAWDPAQTLTPHGEASLTNLEASLKSIIIGAGQIGCGFESQNEAWYRFLVDPVPFTPFAPYTYDNAPFAGSAIQIPAGVDQALLTQRQKFLRPDSLLAIINVTDETDTSVKAEGSAPLISDGQEELPFARTECTTKGPDDPCCASCAEENLPADCPAEAACMGSSAHYTYGPSGTDNFSLHAFGLESDKVRYGAEFYYPPSRYVEALTQKTIVGRDGKTYPNPIFSVIDPSQTGVSVRDQSLVFYGAITGVPWQLIARQTNGVPDLSAGFKSYDELNASDGKGATYWDDIVGDPETYVAPRSPFMVESTGPRSGVDPITGASIDPTSTPNGSGAQVGGALLNDHEFTIPAPAGNIEYACIFPILQPLDCTKVTCDCAASDSPLCEGTMQTKAKAYPGLKNLTIAKGMGQQGIAASLCAKTVDPTDIDSPEYGYRPAVTAIIDRLKTAIGNPCLPLQPTIDPTSKQVSCLVLEARDVGSAPCTCTATARADVGSNQDAAIAQAKVSEPSTESYCFCEVTPTTGAALTSCQNDAITSDADGWCYVDDTHGNPMLVANCPASEQREIRFVGAGKQAPSSVLFISCEQD